MIILPTFRGCLASVAFSPSDIAGLGLWLDASAITGLSDGDAVSTWSDLSGAGRNATGSGASRPVYKTNIANGLPVVRADGVDDQMAFSAPTLFKNVTGATVIAALKWRTSPTNHETAFHSSISGVGTSSRVTLSAGNPSGKWLAGGRRLDANSFAQVSSAASLSTVNFTVVADVFDYSAATLNQYVNGSLDGTSSSFQTSGSTSNTDASVGALFSYGGFGYADVDLAELLVWPRALNNTERAQVEAYLKAKWGTP